MLVFFSNQSPLLSLIITFLGCSGLLSYLFKTVRTYILSRLRVAEGGRQEQREQQNSQGWQRAWRSQMNTWLGWNTMWNIGARFSTAGTADRGTQQEPTEQRQPPSKAGEIHRLPLVEYYSPEEMKSWSVARLKKELLRSGKRVSQNVVLEKSDLVTQVLESWGGSSSSNCAVCLVDYEKGDALRVLPCFHRYHVECIDKWLMSRSRACPLCNQPIS